MEIIEFDRKCIYQIKNLWNQELYVDTMNVDAFSSLVLGDINFDKKYFLLAVRDDIDILVGFILGCKATLSILRERFRTTSWVHCFSTC